jgi:solute carrier family 25 2-oxodicarboxylate transporter 21
MHCCKAKSVGRYPLDVVKTRIQLQHGAAMDGQGYTGVLDCFKKIIRNEGATRLYRGITAPILMEVPKRWPVANQLKQRLFTDTM